jgi:hypothetical protein
MFIIIIGIMIDIFIVNITIAVIIKLIIMMFVSRLSFPFPLCFPFTRSSRSQQSSHSSHSSRRSWLSISLHPSLAQPRPAHLISSHLVPPRPNSFHSILFRFSSLHCI